MKKRLLTLFLVVVMLLMMLPTAAFAAGESISFSIDDGVQEYTLGLSYNSAYSYTKTSSTIGIPTEH